MSLIPEAGGGGGLTNPLTTDLDFGGFKGINCDDPTLAQDVATKAYVDGGAAGGPFLALAGGTMTGAIAFSGVPIGTITSVGEVLGIGGSSNLSIVASGSGDLILDADTGTVSLTGASAEIDTSGSVLIKRGVLVANPTGQAGTFKAFDVSGIESTGSDAYGLYVNQLQSTANDTYGVYIGDMAAVNDAYGIYENADPAFTTNPPKNYFRNKVGIGKEPTVALDVSGAASINGGLDMNTYSIINVNTVVGNTNSVLSLSSSGASGSIAIGAGQSIQIGAPSIQIINDLDMCGNKIENVAAVTSLNINATSTTIPFLVNGLTSSTADVNLIGVAAISVSQTDTTSSGNIATGIGAAGISVAGTNGRACGLFTENIITTGSGGESYGLYIQDISSASLGAGIRVNGDIIGGAGGNFGILESTDTANTINVLRRPLVLGRFTGTNPPTTAGATLDVCGNILVRGGTLDMCGNKIVNVANGTNPNDAVNFSQISGIIDPSGTYLKLIGGTLTGQLAIARDASSVPHLLLSSTNAGATPINEEVFRDAVLVAADAIHQKSYYGDSSTGTKREFVREVITCRDPTNAAEDGSITTSIMRAGTLTQYERIDGLNNNISIGRNAGLNIDASGGTTVVAIGEQAGQNALTGAVCIGDRAGQSLAKGTAVAIGSLAGTFNCQSRAVAIGESAGQSNCGIQSVAIGYRAGQLGNGFGTVAVGDTAGQTSQGNYAVALGTQAGQTSQAAGAFAFGIDAGQNSQGTVAVAMGGGAGRSNQGQRAIAIGENAGNTSQQQRCIAFGEVAGQSNQSEYSIAIGANAGNSTQGANSIAIGRNAGQTSIGADCIAIGRDSVVSSTGSTSNSVAVGFEAMRVNGSTGCVSIGFKANRGSAGANSIMIGSYSTDISGAGSRSIAIGRDAVANSSTADSITLNASGTAITANQAGLFVAPIRGVAHGLGVGVLKYDPSTKEITYSTD
jgi:hypothetical protein